MKTEGNDKHGSANEGKNEETINDSEDHNDCEVDNDDIEEDDDNAEEDDDDSEEDEDDCCHQMVPDVPSDPPDNDYGSCGRLMSRGEAIQVCKLCGYDNCSECIN